MRWMTERMAASAGMDVPVFPGLGHHQDPGAIVSSRHDSTTEFACRSPVVECLMFPGSLYMASVLAFTFAARDDDFDVEVDFGEHVDFDFLRLCFLGIEGRSTGGRSLSVSSVGRLPIASPKSTRVQAQN
ncbi:hypothetical protein E3N88_05216 [Mikania micrantha]|uniref:Uncharacterized protein n=1 Tax=Mikania micrantha TaxID=192012 RepID=A0A5N6PYS9_9ASTR|nr:hypothetical protein E3N88_05216 [Mikania micrantha]